MEETDVNQVPVSEEPTPTEVVTEVVPVKPGEKTDPALLLKSLHEEKEKRRLLEAELELARKEQANVISEPISDEGRFLKSQIDTIAQKLAEEEKRKQLEALQSAFPALKDKSAEFEAFRSDPENAGMKLETAARAFLVERDLLTPPAPRKGLEQNSGGTRTVPKEGLTPEEIKDLRVNNFRKYSDMVRSGKIKL